MSNEGMNKVWLLGNLGADPELRRTHSGQAVLHFRLATTEVYFDKNKQKQERTEWHNVTVWAQRGEALSKILMKGSKVSIVGRLHYSSYEKDGVKKTSSEIVADDVVLLGTSRPNGMQHPVVPEPPVLADIPF